MQILETKENKKAKNMVIKDFDMKRKDYVRKIQLDWAFCIHNFLDATLVLELLFRFEWWAIPTLVQRFKAFTNSSISSIGSCAWGTSTFCLVASLAACNLKQFGQVCPAFPQKWKIHKGLSCFLPLGKLGLLGLDSFRPTLIFLGARTPSFGFSTSILDGLEEGTKFVE